MITAPRRLLPLLLAGLLAACGTTQVALPYAPAAAPAPVAGARPVVAMGNVTDNREGGREDPAWIATIRGGYGNPVKRLDAGQPVREVVAKAFADALAARGLLAAGAPRYRLAVVVEQLSGNQYVRREATAEFRVTLTDAAGGAPLWSETGRATVVDGSVLSLSVGVFASTDDMREVVQRAMTQAIDEVLGKPGLAAALR